MYREHKSYAALTNENDDWQDWPPDTSSASRSGSEAALRLTRPGDALIAREYRPSQLLDHPIPQDRGKVPALLAEPGVQLAASDQKPRRRAAKKVMVLGVLLVLAGGAWYGHYWWTTPVSRLNR